MRIMILAVSAFLVSSLAVAQDTVTVTPVMDGAYGDMVCAGEGTYFEWPSAATTWAGCANTAADIYPLDFPNGGTLTMTASATGGDCVVDFTAEATPGGGAAYVNSSSQATVSGSTPTEYQLEFDNEEDGRFMSLIMNVRTRDCGVNITAMSLEHGPVELTEEEAAEIAACEDTSVIRFEDAFGAKDGNNPDVTCLTDTYVVPTGAESWAGFGDTARGDYYPFEFPYGGTLTFEGSATTETDVEFLFQTAPFPNNQPEQGVVVKVAAGGEGSRGRATYSVDIPASDNSYGNLVFYVGTNGNPSFDNPVTISNIVIAAAAAPAPPAPAAPVPALPFWALLGLAGLVGLFGFRRR